MKRLFAFLLYGFAALSAYGAPPYGDTVARLDLIDPWVELVKQLETPDPVTPDQIVLEKKLAYDKYTLEDSYPYGRRSRSFQWEKIKENLALLETVQQTPSLWGFLRNRHNRNGESPLVKKWILDRYNRIADTLGTERWQGIPLYEVSDTMAPVLYGMDGALVRILEQTDGWREIETICEAGRGRYLVPERYVRPLADTVTFRKVALVDRRMQHIALLEKKDSVFQGDHRKWLIRSMNPATTGVDEPPYAQPTPLGVYVIQEKKRKMIFLKDGSDEEGGFAPWASRFCNGAYIHGVPVNLPDTVPIEYSWSLGTTPRSHMCVRNATSHAKFFYDWAPVGRTLVVIIE